MKILRIIARLNVGGPARHVVWLTEQLNKGEFESVLIAGTVPPGEANMNYVAEQHGVEPVFIEEMSRELSPKDIVSLIKIFREIRRQKPDVIHTHTAKAGTLGRAAAFLFRLTPGGRGVRIVHTFHGHVFHSYYGNLKTRIFIKIEKLLARFATDKIVVISQQQFHEIHEDVGIGRREQFAIIPLGIDLSVFDHADQKRQPFRDEISATEDEIIVGFVGRLTEIKDVSLYLQVAAAIQRTPASRHIRFVVVGDGHLSEGLEREARELGLDEAHVKFLGNRIDVASVYAGLDIVSLTSLNEGTPLSLIEAMAASRPVISTVVGGVLDLLGAVVEEKDGFRVCERGVGIDGRSPDDFTKGLIYLAENLRLRKSLAEKGRAYVESAYSKERLAGDIVRLYRTLTTSN